MIIVAVPAALTLALSVIEAKSLLDVLPIALLLLLSAIPVALPAMFTVSLAVSSMELADKGVLITRLDALEDAASMDVFCVDKTGTLTENKMRLILYVDINGNESEKVLQYSYLNSYYQTEIKSPSDEAVPRFREIDVQGL